MTDEEFERLKAAEKEHLREKKRLQSQLRALKKQQRTQSVVQKMKHGAERLLSETESLVDALRRQFAKQEARLEGALDDEDELQGTDELIGDEQLREYEETRREERAEALLRQYKASQSPTSRSGSAPDGDEEPDADASGTSEGPEKTIGRMRAPRSGEDE